jgi:hypothetical protein
VRLCSAAAEGGPAREVAGGAALIDGWTANLVKIRRSFGGRTTADDPGYLPELCGAATGECVPVKLCRSERSVLRRKIVRPSASFD